MQTLSTFLIPITCAIIILNKATESKKFSTQLFRLAILWRYVMTTQTSLVAGQVRLRQWAEQIRDRQNRGFGNAYSWSFRGGKSIWKNIGQTPTHTTRRAIHLHPRLYADFATKFSPGKAGRAEEEKCGRSGSAVSGIR